MPAVSCVAIGARHASNGGLLDACRSAQEARSATMLCRRASFCLTADWLRSHRVWGGLTRSVGEGRQPIGMEHRHDPGGGEHSELQPFPHGGFDPRIRLKGQRRCGA